MLDARPKKLTDRAILWFSTVSTHENTFAHCAGRSTLSNDLHFSGARSLDRERGCTFGQGNPYGVCETT